MKSPLGGVRRPHVRLLVAALAGAAVTLALVPAFAAPLAGTDTYPKVAVLARNDVPFDAQTAGPMAAALGAPIFITSPTALSQAARDGITAFNPTVLIVSGGPAAISDGVAAEAAAACEPDCTIDRRSGEGRDETAADLATIPGDYGFTRPSLIGDNQVVGDLNVGGAVNADSLTVQDDTLVTNLNADRLDGLDANQLAPRSASATFEPVSDVGTSVTNVGSLEIDVPVAGTIIASAQGNFVIFGAETVAFLGIADSPTELVPDTAGVASVGLLDGTDSIRRRWAASPVSTFEVNAGTHTIYLNAQKSSTFGTNTVNLTPTILTLTFVPAG